MRFAVTKAGRTPPKVTAWSVLQHSEPHQVSCPAHPGVTHEGVWLEREVGTKPCQRWPPHCHLQTEGPGPGSRTQASGLRPLRLLTGAEANTAGLFGEYAILKQLYFRSALPSPPWSTAFHNHTRRQGLFFEHWGGCERSLWISEHCGPPIWSSRSWQSRYFRAWHTAYGAAVQMCAFCASPYMFVRTTVVRRGLAEAWAQRCPWPTSSKLSMAMWEIPVLESTCFSTLYT